MPEQEETTPEPEMTWEEVLHSVMFAIHNMKESK